MSGSFIAYAGTDKEPYRSWESDRVINRRLSLNLWCVRSLYIIFQLPVYVTRFARDRVRWPPAVYSTKATILTWSENNFAIRFLLETPIRGFPIQIKFFDRCRVPTNNTNHIFQRTSCFNMEIPSYESQAGDIIANVPSYLTPDCPWSPQDKNTQLW